MHSHSLEGKAETNTEYLGRQASLSRTKAALPWHEGTLGDWEQCAPREDATIATEGFLLSESTLTSDLRN